MSDPFASSWPDDLDDSPGWTFDSADYELCWPRGLFVRELAAVSRSRSSTDRRAWIERLLEEAFLGTVPVEDFKSSRSEYVSELIRQAPRLREHHAPRASGRLVKVRPGKDPSVVSTSSTTTRTPHRHAAGRRLPRASIPHHVVDDQTGVDSDPEALLAERLGVEGLWPLRPSLWDDGGMFFDLIEVFHDLIARPRSRGYHSWNQCGWHYSDFSSDIGRALYRWKVNALLAWAGSNCTWPTTARMSAGWCVASTTDGRSRRPHSRHR